MRYSDDRLFEPGPAGQHPRESVHSGVKKSTGGGDETSARLGLSLIAQGAAVLPTLQQSGTEKRRIRWTRRLASQRVLDWVAGQRAAENPADAWKGLPKNLAGCGRWSHDGTVEVRGLWNDDGLTAFPVGAQTCASVWSCPVCSAKIRTRRQLEVELAASRHVGGGGRLFMLTLTLRHNRGQSLAELLDGLKASWRSLQQRRDWRPIRAQLAGMVVSTEITHGPNGWHPHLHVLLFLGAGVDDQVLVDLEGTLPTLWKATVSARLGVAPDLAHGIRLQELDAGAAQYVAKIAAETTRADLKTNSRSPWLILDEVITGNPQTIALWLEYVATTKGKRAITMSRQLRTLYLDDVDEKTDEEIANEVVDALVLEEIPSKVWAKWCTTLRWRANQHGITRQRVVRAVLELEAIEDKHRSLGTGLPDKQTAVS